MLESRPLSSSKCNKTFDFSILYSPLKAQRQIERISPTVFHKEEWRTQIQMPCLRKGQILFCKNKNTLILPRSSLKLISWTCLSFWLKTYLLCLVDMCFNRQSAYEYFLCSSSRWLAPLFVWGRLHTVTSEEKGKEASRSFNFTFRYIDDVLSLNNCKFGDFVDRIYPIELEIKDISPVVLK